MTQTELQSLVEQAAAHARVRSPRLFLYQGRNASYHPWLHRIRLSRLLAAKLSSDELRALIGHEVYHATQRSSRLRALLAGFLPPLLLLVGLWWFLSRASDTVLGPVEWSAALAALALTATIQHILEARQGRALLKLETEADRFADAFAGAPGAMASAIRTSAALEDHGRLTAASQHRISSMQK